LALNPFSIRYAPLTARAFYDILPFMTILITNDDGLSSEGIQILAAHLRDTHEVWVVAPSSNRSGVSHGITMGGSLELTRCGHQEYSCSGLPVDCSITAFEAIMPRRPDAVISGINRGANIGTDIVFSGTAAAARQASFSGIPGIAVSLVCEDERFHWEPLARFVRDNLDTLVSLCDRDIFVNINAPSLPRYRGARITGISRRLYKDSIRLETGNDGQTRSFFEGGTIDTHGDDDCDWRAVSSGFVSVSRVHAQPLSASLGEIAEPAFKV